MSSHVTSGLVSFPSRYACRPLTQPTDNKFVIVIKSISRSPCRPSAAFGSRYGRIWILQITVYYKELLTINCQGTNHPRSILSFMDISILYPNL